MLLTTEKAMSVTEIKSKLNTEIDLEKYGEIGDYYELNVSGKYTWDLEVLNPKIFTLFLLDLEEEILEELRLLEGTNKIFLNVTGHKCLLLIGNSSDKNIGSVEIIKRSPIKEPEAKLTVSGMGDYSVDIPNNKYLISTNKGKSVTTVSNFFFGDREYLTKLSADYKQASGIGLMNLPLGKYTVEIKVNKSDSQDVLLVNNGRENYLITEAINLNLDVSQGYIYFMAIDKSKTSGTTEFELSNLTKTGELDYIPPKPLPLTFNDYLGTIKDNKK